MAAPGSESNGSQDGGDEYVTLVASSSSPSSHEASQYVTASMDEVQILAAIEKSREQGWSEVADHVRERAAGTSSWGLSVEDQLLWKKLKEEAPKTFVDRIKGLKLGRLIAEGGQAHIYDVTLLGGCPPMVAKVFKMEGFSLVDLQRQWPRAKRPCTGSEGISGLRSLSATTLGEFIFEDKSTPGRGCVGTTFCTSVWYGFFLSDGRFAFLSKKYAGDLRTMINLRLRDNDQGPPFSYKEVLNTMYHIATGMRSLHVRGVLHRDLKVANVLFQELSSLDEFYCVVADNESSMLVQGTGFWRAPEVLEDLLKKPCERNKEIWTEKVDVYSYAMTCYEVMIGHVPFYGYVKSDWHRVIEGERPHLPDYVDHELGELVERCWHKEPVERPTFDAIVNSLQKILAT